jgi:hypothetical protein
MQFTWEALISRARLYVDDDHDDDKGWLTPAKWLMLGQVEYAQLYRRWATASLIAPEPTDATLEIGTPLEGVLAIIGVAEVYGGDSISGYRVLRPGLQYGAKPFRTPVNAPADSWEAYGAGDSITVVLRPEDTSGVYVVRYVPSFNYTTDPTDTVELPFGGDERLVLGMARRAHLKDSAASALLERLIGEADANLNFLAFARAGQNGRVVKPYRDLSTPGQQFNSDPRMWMWF